MNKAVLISIQPKWCELIASGEKTVEVRKTKPKIDVPFKCYIYETQDKHFENIGVHYLDERKDFIHHIGKVIGEFVCDYITPFRPKALLGDSQIVKISCVKLGELIEYAPNKPFPKDHLYAWHITDLLIYDKPKELSEFNHCGVNYHFNPPITRPPQSWCYVEELN